MKRVVGLTSVLMLVGLESIGAADPLQIREQYEQKIVDRALLRFGLEREPNPEGKTIERILVDESEVIAPGELPLSEHVPYTLLNHLHALTRESVIRQELLFATGERYDAALVAESARNLRAFFILSVALITTARGSSENSVVVLVVTKDKWSLRLNSDFELDQARLDSLSLSIAEDNVLGRNKQASLDFALDPGRYTVGFGYLDPRILGSHHQATLNADLYIDRIFGKPEGGQTTFNVGRPLYSLHTQWGWNAGFVYLQDVYRVFRGADVNYLGTGTALVPEVFDRRNISAALEGTYSTGVLNKLNLTAGFRADSAAYHVPPDFTDDHPGGFSPAAVAALTAVLPRSEDSDGPYIQMQIYRARYVALHDIDTFALSEDTRLGPSLTVLGHLTAPAFGLPSHFVELSGTYLDRRLFHGDLMTVAASLAARIQTGIFDGPALVNEDVQLSARNVSPRFGPFRLHVSGQLHLRNHDLNHVILALGSDDGLRGYAPRQLQGNNLYLLNVELRTLGLNLWSLHVGAVLFYDAGDTPATLAQFGWHQDAGIGLRILIPQVNHEILRLDLAFPFEPTGGSWVPRFSASFNQAF